MKTETLESVARKLVAPGEGDSGSGRKFRNHREAIEKYQCPLHGGEPPHLS